MNYEVFIRKTGVAGGRTCAIYRWDDLSVFPYAPPDVRRKAFLQKAIDECKVIEPGACQVVVPVPNRYVSIGNYTVERSGLSIA